ncbi:guanitoxin biosynthesis L-enduracididine beta-hydroxylase GntD [Streptantibioticus cattleyicolor]|uniref:TauD/TfdA-like domain-containing protein n=1 Tax=Streptantibioticus cattleyicolor (strain ATCC 35852 / DSM 46488 / JCM 4925 / NBRC 14057 / NRRL 8057) TaxID=1003195 RepID=F8JMB5_STREN|nr:guanitoxin biosynthesis L-enduracididine beta-hydroxylase GntD [Streptantibioticus cattleyicolor]AEW99312.1 hypothetical protein SCATT_p11190 [Streptantibioticus cattleyicolor NRRL 8057 = DSM 46488]CCB71649.1 Clavaminic acid synthase-like protein [Streptantibioticus cattleyicolor NRRL 8057 = DSM 46488]
MSHSAVSDGPHGVCRAPGDAPRLRLTAAERTAVLDVADAALAEEPHVPPSRRLPRLAVLAHQLPVRLRTVLTEFRITGRPYGGLVIAGLPVDPEAAGPTPTDYTAEPRGTEVLRAEVVLLLIGSLLGDPFSFATQQRGRLVLDVFPVRGHEDSQLGSSSTQLLEWHNEDAFHEHRADWIALLCVRNQDRVPTLFAPVHDLDLTARDRALLFEERFVILPDESHTAQFNSATNGIESDDRFHQAFERIAAMAERPRRIPILSGDPRAPFVRLDPAFMRRDLDDPPAERTLAAVIDAVDRRLLDVVLDTGDLFLIDNKRAVHGRRPFTARYDGTDRWLRRINITADLRSSEGRRVGDAGRAVV